MATWQTAQHHKDTHSYGHRWPHEHGRVHWPTLVICSLVGVLAGVLIYSFGPARQAGADTERLAQEAASIRSAASGTPTDESLISSPATSAGATSPAAPVNVATTPGVAAPANVTAATSTASANASAASNASPIAGANATGRLAHSPHSYHDGILRVAPSVVSLYAQVGDEDVSQGSGVIVSAQGIVLTSLHLLADAKDISVVLSDGQRYGAKLIGSDEETDLAVVQIPATSLPAVSLTEAPPLRVGDIVLAIGNPFGVGQTVTQGIVSATHRRVAGGSAWQNFVQIDAAINPGNSGGALINPDGQLVGVNTAVFRGDANAIGIGFAIPASLLAQVVPQIIENGRVARGWLGVGADDLAMFPDLAIGEPGRDAGLNPGSVEGSDSDRNSGPARTVEPGGSADRMGAVITGVVPDSPANLVGLKRLDIVSAMNRRPVLNATDLLLQVSAMPPESEVQLTIWRRGQKREFTLRLGERPVVDSALPR